MARRAGEIRCYQCGLPVTGYSQRYVTGDTEESFCCSGCFLVHKITGVKGEEGFSHVLFGKFGVGFLLSMNVMLMSAPLYAGVYASIEIPAVFVNAIRFVLLGLSLPVMLLLGYPILVSSYDSIRSRVLGTEALILIGAVSAFLISVKSTITGTGEVYYETATMILTLFTLGRYLDTRARWRASDSIKGLSSIVPDKVTLLKGDSGTEVIPAGQVSIGDRVILRPGERIPLDGLVITGSASVDESFLTGESRPVFKDAGTEVLGGSLNIDGSLTVEVRKPADQFVIKKIERLMEKIRESSSEIKRIGDTIAGWFVPGIITLSLGSFFYWVSKGDGTTAVMRMLSILLISCPCAFGIAAPLSVWRGLGKAAEKGAIIMGADILEGFSKVKTVFFDKTGTVTSNTLSLSEIDTGSRMPEDELLSLAASLEYHSTHPMAVSLLKEAEERGIVLHDAENLKTRPGLGIEGDINGKRYYLGSRRWLEQMGSGSVSDTLHSEGKKHEGGSAVFLKENDELIGSFLFSQMLRDGAAEAFSSMKGMGIRTVLLTGDDSRGVMEIRDKLCPDEVKWGLLPDGKVREVELNKRGEIVAMVGDGINDAPALEAAHIGIAMGCGTELTRESANINLLGDDLRMIPYLINLSRRVRKKVFTNYFWAFSYNTVGIYLAVIGTITPLFAVAAMILSSLFVIGNSRRL